MSAIGTGSEVKQPASEAMAAPLSPNGTKTAALSTISRAISGVILDLLSSTISPGQEIRGSMRIMHHGERLMDVSPNAISPAASSLTITDGALCVTLALALVPSSESE